MKRLLFLSVLLFVGFAFLGCRITTGTTGSGSSTGTPTTMTTTTVTTEPPTVESVPFTNLSTEFVSDQSGTAIDFYYFEDKPDIPHVDIEEFVTLLKGLLDSSIKVDVEDEETVKVWVYHEYTPQEMEKYGLSLPFFTTYARFHFDDQTVTAPNVDAFEAFSGETETDFSEGLTVVESTVEPEPAFSADVAAYGFSFHHLEGETDKYVIPLSLANLFLTGSMYDVSPNWDEDLEGYRLYGFDTYQYYDIPEALADGDPANDALYDIIADYDDSTVALRTETVNFLAFAFEHFYGLKEYREITDFREYAWDYFPTLLELTFLGHLNDFVESFADGHTSLVSAGRMDPDYEPYQSWFDLPEYLKTRYGAYEDCGCALEESDFQLTFSGSAALLRVSSFGATDFKEQLSPLMEEIRNAGVDKVILDVTCNSGGVVANVLTLLNYLTNENIGLYSSTDGADASTLYDVEGDLAINAGFFILTSGWTYSAANLFAALAQEMGVAQIVGTATGGGACSIQALVLPNGSLVVMSSKTNLTDSTFATLEEGVEADIPLDWGDYDAFPDLEEILSVIAADQTPVS